MAAVCSVTLVRTSHYQPVDGDELVEGHVGSEETDPTRAEPPQALVAAAATEGEPGAGHDAQAGDSPRNCKSVWVWMRAHIHAINFALLFLVCVLLAGLLAKPSAGATVTMKVLPPGTSQCIAGGVMIHPVDGTSQPMIICNGTDGKDGQSAAVPVTTPGVPIPHHDGTQLLYGAVRLWAPMKVNVSRFLLRAPSMNLMLLDSHGLRWRVADPPLNAPPTLMPDLLSVVDAADAIVIARGNSRLFCLERVMVQPPPDYKHTQLLASGWHPSSERFVSLAAAATTTWCGLSEQGTVMCFGEVSVNTIPSLGRGRITAGPPDPTPRRVALSDSVIKLMSLSSGTLLALT